MEGLCNIDMRVNSQDKTGQSWKQLVFYGEVVGFVLAWIVGAVLLTQSQPGDDRLAGVSGLDSFAEVGLSELPNEELK